MPTWYPAAAFASCTTGIPTSPCWAWPKAAGTTCCAAMADNFAWLIDAYGHVPNGNRSYYLSRSQPPVFALMVTLFEQRGVCQAINYLPQLRREYSLVDGRRRGAAPGRGASPLRAAGRRQRAQPLLGRSRHAARRSLPGGRDHRRAQPAPGQRGLSRPARRRRLRLGLQRTLVRYAGRPVEHPHHRPAAGRPELLPVHPGNARSPCSAQPSASTPRRDRSAAVPSRRTRGDPAADVGSATPVRSSTTTGATTAAASG